MAVGTQSRPQRVQHAAGGVQSAVAAESKGANFFTPHLFESAEPSIPPHFRCVRLLHQTPRQTKEASLELSLRTMEVMLGFVKVCLCGTFCLSGICKLTPKVVTHFATIVWYLGYQSVE